MPKPLSPSSALHVSHCSQSPQSLLETGCRPERGLRGPGPGRPCASAPRERTCTRAPPGFPVRFLGRSGPITVDTLVSAPCWWLLAARAARGAMARAWRRPGSPSCSFPSLPGGGWVWVWWGRIPELIEAGRPQMLESCLTVQITYNLASNEATSESERGSYLCWCQDSRQNLHSTEQTGHWETLAQCLCPSAP